MGVKLEQVRFVSDRANAFAYALAVENCISGEAHALGRRRQSGLLDFNPISPQPARSKLPNPSNMTASSDSEIKNGSVLRIITRILFDASEMGGLPPRPNPSPDAAANYPQSAPVLTDAPIVAPPTPAPLPNVMLHGGTATPCVMHHIALIQRYAAQMGRQYRASTETLVGYILEVDPSHPDDAHFGIVTIATLTKLLGMAITQNPAGAFAKAISNLKSGRNIRPGHIGVLVHSLAPVCGSEVITYSIDPSELVNATPRQVTDG